MKAKKKFTFFDKSLLIINTIASILLFYNLSEAEPTSFWQLSTFPNILLISNIILLILWLTRLKIYFLISFISLLVGYFTLRDSLPSKFKDQFSTIINNTDIDYLKSQTVRLDHPRLLLLKGQEQSIKSFITEPYWNMINDAIIKQSDLLLGKGTHNKEKIGKRMLNTSRESLKTLLYLSYAWRMTHKKQYLEKAQEELLSVISFDDWNPSHFLDVAEMTMGVSLAYDWLYDDLPSMYKIAISKAIISKGLEPSMDIKYNYWLNKRDNWNQVCNAAMLCGAIASYEDNPELCKKIINRSIQSLKIGMQSYASNGNYNEGYEYWEYGTTYNIIALEALKENFKTDFGLLSEAGFLESSTYYQNMLGPSGAYFNYSDAGEFSNKVINESMFWFAKNRMSPSLLWNEKNKAKLYTFSSLTHNNFLPLAMIWGNGIDIKTVKPPKQMTWIGNGNNPVALLRSSWTETNALFVGLKSGSAINNHAHMDAGSFVFDAYGVRWAMDFGAENYGQQESRGVDLWDESQNSDRWKILKYNNMGHNTLTFNGDIQSAQDKSQIVKFSDNRQFSFAITDLSKVYKNSVSKEKRGVALVNDNYLVIQDEFKGLPGTRQTVKWNMVTPAKVKIKNGNEATLLQNGNEMLVKVIEPLNVNLTAKPTYIETDGRKNTYFLSFETDVPPNKDKTILVTISSKELNQKTIKKPLDEWK